jgi:hypothetical protein
MASLTLNDIPDDLLARLSVAADEERRGLVEEVLVLIAEALATRAAAAHERRRDRGDQAAAWRELAGRWISDRSVDEELEDIYAPSRLRPGSPEAVLDAEDAVDAWRAQHSNQLQSKQALDRALAAERTSWGDDG